MDHARKLLDEELQASALVTGAAGGPIAQRPPTPVDVIVPPATASKLERAYAALEQEKLGLVCDLGQAHLACVVSDLEDVVAAVEARMAESQRVRTPNMAHHEREQEQLHAQWNAEIRTIINKKLGIQ